MIRQELESITTFESSSKSMCKGGGFFDTHIKLHPKLGCCKFLTPYAGMKAFALTFGQCQLLSNSVPSIENNSIMYTGLHSKNCHIIQIQCNIEKYFAHCGLYIFLRSVRIQPADLPCLPFRRSVRMVLAIFLLPKRI